MLVIAGAQINISGVETTVVGGAPSDQVLPNVAVGAAGGYIVWQDKDKYGAAVHAARLDGNFNPSSPFRVNKTIQGDQERPQVQVLKNGRTVVVWEGNNLKTGDIYLRVLNPTGAFASSDVRVNTFTKDQQGSPSVASLADGSAVVVWSSFGQDGSMHGIFGRALSANGLPVRKEFAINQTTQLNQRHPSVAGLANGNFVVVWLNEQVSLQRFVVPESSEVETTISSMSVRVMGRIFTPAGVPVGNEFLLNTSSNICANPSVAGLGDGSFVAVWSEKNAADRQLSWDVFGRSFDSAGVAKSEVYKINAFEAGGQSNHEYGDQYKPKVTAVGNHSMAVWTSLGQDGSHEGVYGRFLPGGMPDASSAFRINSTTISKQIHPTVAANAEGRIFVGWSSFVALHGFDLFGQQYQVTLQP